MSSVDPVVVARQLDDAGATIWVAAEGAGGYRSFRLDPGDASDFLADPRTWTAKQWGITAAQLDEWDINDRMPRCGATTKRGTRCRNRLTLDSDPDEFVRLHGQYCQVHG